MVATMFRTRSFGRTMASNALRPSKPTIDSRSMGSLFCRLGNGLEGVSSAVGTG